MTSDSFSEKELLPVYVIALLETQSFISPHIFLGRVKQLALFDKLTRRQNFAKQDSFQSFHDFTI